VHRREGRRGSAVGRDGDCEDFWLSVELGKDAVDLRQEWCLAAFVGSI
jgi:hypothetical protein